MPQVATPSVRVSRRTVRILWWSYVGGVLACTAMLPLAGLRSAGGWTAPVTLCVVAAGLAALISHRLTSGLPEAGHRVFDTVGRRFEFAIRQLFLRFVLAGAAAEVTGVLGSILLVLGGPMLVGAGAVVGAVLLLTHLRRRAAPLVHYLA